jgi:hypothetical protein
MNVDDTQATVLDLDPRTRAEVEQLLAGLGRDDRLQAARITELFVAELGAFSAVGMEIPEASPAAWVGGVVAAAPRVAGWMRTHGIPPPLITATLGDVGRHLRLHRKHTGDTGLDAPIWLFAVLSGSLYQLGRLQFDLRGWRADEPVPPIDTGAWVLDVHIPESGPLTPDAVADSFDRAGGFFGQHFPDKPVRVAVCASWLLDPYLGEHLAPSSNMVAFQRQFTPYGDPRDDELDAVYFTFGQRSLDNLDSLPRDSSLQRLVLGRLADGDQWHVVRGYRELSPRTPTTPSR